MNIAAGERKLTRIEQTQLINDLLNADWRSSAFIRGQSSLRFRVSAVQ